MWFKKDEILHGLSNRFYVLNFSACEDSYISEKAFRKLQKMFFEDTIGSLVAVLFKRFIKSSHYVFHMKKKQKKNIIFYAFERILKVWVFKCYAHIYNYNNDKYANDNDYREQM